MNIVLRQHLRKILLFAALLIIDAVVFGSTNADKVASFMLVVGFLLLLATFYYVVYGLLVFARLYGLPIKRKQRLAGSLAVLVGCLVALQSVGELNAHDVLVLLPLVVIGYVYSFYGKAPARREDA